MVHRAQPEADAGHRGPRKIRVVESSATQLRLLEARAFADTHLPHRDVLVVGASRGAADDFARSVAIRSGATIGLHRFSLTQLAARLAAPILAADGLAPATPLGSEAVSARAAFEAQRERALHTSSPVAQTPGFPARWRERSTRSGWLVLPARGSRPCRSAAAISSCCSSGSSSSSLTPLRRIARFSSTPRHERSATDWPDLSFPQTRPPSARRSAWLSRRVRLRRGAHGKPSLGRGVEPASARHRFLRRPSSAQSPRGHRSQGGDLEPREMKTSPRCIATCSPARSRQSASFAATCDSSRRRAKDGSRSRLRAGFFRRPGPAYRSTRWPCSFALPSDTSVCSSTH